MRFFVAVLVTITILLLPLATLLTLQTRFLAYQSEAVTWVQRVAIWLDVGFVAVLWPVIMDRRDSWSAFMKCVWDNLRQNRFLYAWSFAGIAIALTWLASTSPGRQGSQRKGLPRGLGGFRTPNSKASCGYCGLENGSSYRLCEGLC